jgi:tetratricopeptide (TPR) repeat protein
VRSGDLIVSDESRIDALRKRLQRDPGSIAFAQLAEEYRRAGRVDDAIEVSRAGLARHPGYLSARVTLGRALLEVGDVDGAERELAEVVRVAPENLSAIRGLADVHRKRGERPEALEQFKSAFELAGPDPTIDELMRDLRRDAVAPSASSVHPPQPAAAPVPGDAPASPGPAGAALTLSTTTPGQDALPAEPAGDPRAARRTVAYLERWLEAILADRRARLYGAYA